MLFRSRKDGDEIVPARYPARRVAGRIDDDRAGAAGHGFREARDVEPPAPRALDLDEFERHAYRMRAGGRERAGKILREDMEALGPVRLKDVDEAQMRMVNVAKDLANKGEIMIASKQGEDELIY